jgi:hypothetical protein
MSGPLTLRNGQDDARKFSLTTCGTTVVPGFANVLSLTFSPFNRTPPCSMARIASGARCQTCLFKYREQACLQFPDANLTSPSLPAMPCRKRFKITTPVPRGTVMNARQSPQPASNVARITPGLDFVPNFDLPGASDGSSKWRHRFSRNKHQLERSVQDSAIPVIAHRLGHFVDAVKALNSGMVRVKGALAVVFL